MKKYEIYPEGSKAPKASTQGITWNRVAGKSGGVSATFGWELQELGAVDQRVGDLLRIAVAAFIADRLTTRGRNFSRAIEITVHVVEKNLWTKILVNKVEKLLSWLTGDVWVVKLSQQKLLGINQAFDFPSNKLDEVVLLSGGLDSFSGAVDLLNRKGTRLFIGHHDGASAVKHAQDQVKIHLSAQSRKQFSYKTHQLTQTAPKKESSTRSRSLMFMSLATVIASAHNASSVIVPENGYTSINLPLNASRGGALSTRSTHQITFSRVNEIISLLGAEAVVSNPYDNLTKGELVRTASAKFGRNFSEAVADTLSCSKLDGTYYRGGNPNIGCGLCVPCIVRRSSILAAGVDDKTEYLHTCLSGDAELSLIKNRSIDILAVKESLQYTVSDVDIMSCGPWPDKTSIDDVLSLYNRGVDELQTFSNAFLNFR